MSNKRRLNDSDRAEAILHAAVHGDAAACARYGCTSRSLRNWRTEVRDTESALSAVFRKYASALQPDEAAVETRSEGFVDYVRGQIRKASDILVKKAEDVNAANPEGLRAINEHVATLLEHVAALEYIGRLFAPAPDDEDPEAE